MLALLPQSHVGDWAVPDTDRAKARIFISYKRAVEPDERVALEVYHALAAAHDVFIDRSIEIGDPWGKEIAQRIGAPNAVRAVAGACAANAIAVAIPCHRVVRSDGGLAGYRWGVERKQTLLTRET